MVASAIQHALKLAKQKYRRGLLVEPFKRYPFGHQFFYLLSDPWNFSGSFETGRFERTTSVIEEMFGKLDAIYELGCGEGHFTSYLTNISDRVIGCDVSGRALERARAHVPGAEFCRVDLNEGLPSRLPSGGNRLILAAEMLYYLKDPGRLLEEMISTDAHIMVTLFRDEVGAVEKLLLKHSFSGPRVISSLNPKKPDHSWYVYWLKRPSNG